MKDMIVTYGWGLVAFLGLAWGMQFLQPKPSLPEMAPAFDLVDLDGNTVSLEALRGQKVVLNFWATWCGPCRAEIPHFSKYAKEHPDITILGLTTETQEPRLQQARRSLGIAYPVVLADSETAAAYDITTLPTTIVVEPDGRVGFVQVGAMSARQLENAVGD